MRTLRPLVRLALACGILAASLHYVRPTAAVTGGHLTLGNPSGATTNTLTPTNYLIDRAQYAMSYHRDAGITNWTSWHLGLADLGSTPRGDFITDTSLPTGWYRVTTSDYTNSGYDRGHMVPSGDRTANTTDNNATFFMTNILPQAPDNNQGPWEALESYTRSLIQGGSEAYIISGGAGSIGTLAGGRVRIPARTWKIVVVMPEGTNDLSRITTSTRVIAVNLPNQQGIRTNTWQSYLTTVDALEALTGYDFLSNVSTTIQSTIEARVDGSTTPLPTATSVVPTPTTVPPTATPSPTGCVSDLFISEYIEGSSNNKAIEIYNGTGAAISLSSYSIRLYANGTTSATSSATLSGSIPSGGTYVIANSSASSTILSKANLTSAVASFNGNDAVTLLKNSIVIDAFGQIGNDPGTLGWGSGTTSTTDHTLRRNASILSGDATSSDSFTPAVQWTGYAVDTVSGLGSHAHTCP